MADNFLSSEELAKKLADFKDMWYGISSKSESLNSFKSGSDSGFKEALKVILSDLKSSKTELGILETELKHTIPEIRNEMGDITGNINKDIGLFEQDIKRDLNETDTLDKFSNKLNTLDKDLKKAEANYRSFEKESSKVETKYFDMKSEYALRRQQIEGETKTSQDKLKKKFEEKVEPLIDEQELFLGSEKVDPKKLFNRIIESRSNVEDIKLIAKKGGGIFARKSQEDNKARSSVLKYVASDVLEDLDPIKKEEQRKIKTLNSEFSEFKTLERACQKNEIKLKELSKQKEDIFGQVTRIHEDRAFRLLSQDGVLELRENYLDHFNKVHDFMKEFFETSGKTLDSYEPPETDLEKRELRVKNKELSASVKDLDERASSAEKELDARTKELEKIKAAKTELETQLEDVTSKLTKSEKEREGFKQKSIEISKGVDVLKKDVADRLKELESSVNEKVEDIKALK